MIERPFRGWGRGGKHPVRPAFSSKFPDGDLKSAPKPADNATVPSDGGSAARTRTKSVGPMADETEFLRGGSVRGPVPPGDAQSSVVAAAQTVAPPAAERPRWVNAIAISTFSAVLAVTTVTLVLWGPFAHSGPLRLLLPQWEMFAVVLALCAAAVWAPVSLHSRGNTYLIALDAVPILLGLVFLSRSMLVLACVCAEVFVFLIIRRQAPIKLAFNVASFGLAAAVSAVVFREFLGTHGPVSLLGWAAAAAALCTAALMMAVTLRIVVKLHGQTVERRTGSHLATQALLTGASICLAIVVLDAAWFDPWATIPVSLVGVLIIVDLQGICPAVPPLRLASAPLRLQPGAGYRELGAVVDEHGRAASSLHGHAGYEGRN